MNDSVSILDSLLKSVTILKKLEKPKVNDKIIKSRYSLAYVKVRTKLSHVYYIFNRLSVMLKKYSTNQILINKIMSSDNYGKGLEFTEAERILFSDNAVLSNEIELEIENLFLHSRILMDDFAIFSVFFIEEDSFLNSNKYYSLHKYYRSFNRQKKWLSNQKEFKFLSYKELVLDTNWFDNSLKNYRDDYIAHSTPRMYGTSIMYEGSYTKAYFFENLTELDSKRIISLKNKYTKNNHNFKTVMDNVFEIISFIDDNDVLLERDDLLFINQIKKKGGKSPNIKKLMKNIESFVTQYVSIFS